MKIEAGKTYRTRSGLKARCIADDVKYSDGYSVLCLIDEDSCEYVWRYYPDGRYYAHDESVYDLVAEWKEPRTHETYVFLIDHELNGDVYTSTDPNREFYKGNPYLKVLARKRMRITEGEFDE